MIVISLNGPAKSGKDTLAEDLMRTMDASKYFVTQKQFKELLFNVAIKAAGITPKLFYALYEREYKEKPSPYLMVNGESVSPRQWMIHCSEAMMKPIFGNDVFGQAFVKTLKDLSECGFEEDGRKLVIVMSDGGFLEEAIPVVEYVGRENFFLTRIHRLKEDGTEYDFTGDSRNYIYAKQFPENLRPAERDIWNINGDIFTTVKEIIKFVEGKDA